MQVGLKEANEEELLRFFQQQLERSGHSLENKVEEDLLNDRFSVLREVPYIDKDEAKGRNIDLVAYAEIPSPHEFTQQQQYHIVGRINLIIECKNLPNHGWIFFKTKKPELVFPDKVTIADRMPIEITEYDRTRNYSPITPIPNLFSASGYDEYVFDNGRNTKNRNTKNKKKSNERTENIYDAVNKVTKATRYQIETTRDLLCNKMQYIISKMDKIISFAVFQPLIVFQGFMYGATVTNGKNNLEPIKFAQIPKQYVSSNYDEMQGMIHVVSYKYLQEYLNLLHNYYWFASSRMIKEQDSLLALVYEIVEYTQRRMHRHRSNCNGNFQKIIEYTDGKPFVGKLNDVRNPIVYLYRSKDSTDECKYDMNKVDYERGISYCFNCGKRISLAASSNKKDYCCISFKTSQESGAVEVVKINNEEKFLLNLLPRSQSTDFINLGCSKIVERAGLNWCPFCGINLEEEIPKS